MFELKIALRYLIPRKKSLSTALISLLSVAVISVVVWLVLVFLSVTAGIERNWLNKLTSLHAPVRITPTDDYYRSYYYRIDSLAASSNYTLKTIGEKARALATDPYSPSLDAEIPPFWPHPDLSADGRVSDPVKGLLSALEKEGVLHQDYEISGALLRLPLVRSNNGSTLSQMSYLLSLTDQNPQFSSLLLPPTQEDFDALAKTFGSDPDRLAAIEKYSKQIHFENLPLEPLPWAIDLAGTCRLPKYDSAQPALLPKSYRDLGLRLGDKGTLHFAAQGSLSAQEHKIAIQIAGFYDPGLFSVGGRCLIVPQEVTRTIHSSSQIFSPDGTPANGVFVWDQSGKDAQNLKERIESSLKDANLSSFWKVATYKDYEFSKELFLQFRSDRTLFLFIAVLILLVACCNIISLLVLLVNDKRREIAILQAMGASWKSIAAIFGFCGFATGLLSSLIGVGAAILTLHHLDSIVAILSACQGHAAFQPAFFGHALPNELSREALLFVLIATPLLSLGAGLIPALRAMRIHIATALRDA